MNKHLERLLRRTLIPVFARVNPGDITIRHHFTGDTVRLHSFRHKGYWFRGKRREWRTMELLPRIIRPADQVVEVGGHIGYVSLYFARLVGPRGHVWVFEPGENNLPYTHRNLDAIPNITVIEKGVGRANETLPLYLEELTGQNNSFVPGFYLLEQNKRSAGVRDVAMRESSVELVRLDDFVGTAGFSPDFVKVDVEGFELAVIEGMLEVLRKARPAVMIEIQADHEAIITHFIDAGYLLYVDDGRRIRTADDVPRRNTPYNFFGLHPERHERELSLFDGSPHHI